MSNIVIADRDLHINSASKEVRVFYFVPEDGDIESSPNAFNIHLHDNKAKISLEVLRRNFPLPGEYFFRLKRRFHQQIVWEDLNDSSEIGLTTTSDCITIKANRLSFKENVSGDAKRISKKKSSGEIWSSKNITKSNINVIDENNNPKMSVNGTKKLPSTNDLLGFDNSTSVPVHSQSVNLDIGAGLDFALETTSSSHSASNNDNRKSKLKSYISRSTSLLEAETESVGPSLGDGVGYFDSLDWNTMDYNEFDTQNDKVQLSEVKVNSQPQKSKVFDDFSPFENLEDPSKQISNKSSSKSFENLKLTPTGSNISKSLPISRSQPNSPQNPKSKQPKEISLQSLANDFSFF